MNYFLIVDDHYPILNGYSTFLKSKYNNHYEILKATSLESARKHLNNFFLELLIIDIHIPSTDNPQISHLESQQLLGLQLGLEARRRNAQSSIIFISADYQLGARVMLKMKELGNEGVAYLTKGTRLEKLAEVIDTIKEGKVFIDPMVTFETFSHSAENFISTLGELERFWSLLAYEQLATLSKPKRRVLELVAQGYIYSKIANILGITEDAIQKHVRESKQILFCEKEPEGFHVPHIIANALRVEKLQTL